MAFSWTPVTGLNDTSAFPSKDTGFRARLQSLLQQLATYTDTQLTSKATKRTSLNVLNGWERDADTGIIEQWGYGYVAGPTGNTITLPISETDTNYIPILTPYYTGSGVPNIKITNVTKYNFTVASASETYFYWRVKGW